MGERTTETRAAPTHRRFDLVRVRLAASSLRAGGIVAHATEGVWGLACDPFDVDAVERILFLKQRQRAKGLILIGASSTCFAPEMASLSASETQRILASWPGANTWILPSRRFPRPVSVGRGASATVAVRVPGHAQARLLCAAFGGPLISTSANPSGIPAASKSLKVRRWFGRDIDFLLPGQTLGRPGPSRLCTLAGERLR